MICLGNNRVLCGRRANGCMLSHIDSKGCRCKLALDFVDLNVFDFFQEASLDIFRIPELHPHFSLLHMVKFGEPAQLPVVKNGEVGGGASYTVHYEVADQPARGEKKRATSPAHGATSPARGAKRKLQGGDDAVNEPAHGATSPARGGAKLKAAGSDGTSAADTLNAAFNALVARTEALPYRMPTAHNNIATICGSTASLRRQVVAHAQTTWALVHSTVAALAKGFLELKREHGTGVEKTVYGALAGVPDLLDRFLKKRPLSFLTAADAFLLVDGTHGCGGFDALGSAAEQAPFLLADYLSYDEIQLAALLAVSTPTFFINSGGRTNRGRPGVRGSFERAGVYVALVGARFERPGKAEFEHCIVTEAQNRADRGYGPDTPPSSSSSSSSSSLSTSGRSSGRARWEQRARLQLWARSCYGLEHLPLYSEAVRDRTGRFVPLKGLDCHAFLDLAAFRKRCLLVAQLFLAEANARAAGRGARGGGGGGGGASKGAFCHVVGLGLGVWQVHGCQGQVLVDAYAEALGAHRFPHVDDLYFSWFPADCQACGGVKTGRVLAANGNRVKVHFGQRDPAEKLAGVDEGKLLVAQYAWDGNSWPGNEYWNGSLAASGDPAAACCSTIPQLQNPHVNLDLNGATTRVANFRAGPGTEPGMLVGML